MMTFIYTLSDPITNEIRYVGKTKNPSDRLKGHIKESYKKNTYKNNWVNGLITKNNTPIMEIIDEVEENWQFWESFYIYLFKSWGFNLTNMTDGGEGVSFCSNIIRKKISDRLKEYHKEHKYSEERINKIRERMKGNTFTLGKKIHSQKHINKLRERMKGNTFTLGKKLTEEHKKSIGDSQRGKEKHSEETKKIISEKNSGEKNGMYGKKHTEDSLKKISERSTGEKHPSAKLTEKDVLEIRRLYKNKVYKQTKIAKMFNVKVRTIYSITSGESWKHLK
jgi:hypothetical protein